jgi:hypothetical protein
MSNLRSLLGTRDTELIGIHSGGIGNLRRGQSTWFMMHICGSCAAFDSAYNNMNTLYQCWRVPGSPTGTGTTVVTFEIWGGGGAGAGACCCMIGVPGGAGAYARKTVTGIASGTAYDICIGTLSCGVPGDTGSRGCKSYITGSGLSNFCAEGGHSGCSFCHLCWGYGSEWVVAMGGAAAGCCGLLYGGCYGVAGWGGACAGCCALFYGADFGAFGLPSAATIYQWTACRELNRYHFAYPGGLVNEQGGYVSVAFCENTICSYFESCGGHNAVGFGGGDRMGYVPGMPGGSARVCAGPCCCGMQGRPGAARITVNWI